MTGLRDIQSMNKVMLWKWLWHFGQEEGSLWRQVVAMKFGLEDRWDIMLNRWPYGCSPWREIIQYYHFFKEGVVYEVGDGSRIKFWEDVWCGERSLK